MRATIRLTLLVSLVAVWSMGALELATTYALEGHLPTLAIALAFSTCVLTTILLVRMHHAVSRRVRDLGSVAHEIVVGTTRYNRNTAVGDDAIDWLEHQVHSMARDSHEQHDQLVQTSALSFFDSRLQRGLELSENPDTALELIGRAVREILPEAPAELLMVQENENQLAPAVVVPGQDAPGCPVTTTESCAAVRNGQVMVFSSSKDLDSCPKLRDRGHGPCSAVCLPINSMGRAIGVIHVTGPDGWKAPAERRERLEVTAYQTGLRLGLLQTLDKTSEAASKDPLTGLLNRRAFSKRIARALRGPGPHSLAMIDLDHFKRLNDTLGHEAGDDALRLFADLARTAFRKDDIPARHGGEEFVLLLSGCAAEDARSVLDTFRQRVEERSAAANLTFTVSIGFACYPDHGAALPQLLRHADRAVYKAKEAGRNRVVMAGDTTPVAAVPDVAVQQSALAVEPRRPFTAAVVGAGAGPAR